MSEWFDIVADALDAERVERVCRVQSLWSGYGEVVRITVHGGPRDGNTLIVKHVAPPDERNHPRGWTSDVGHRRKLRSYEVELAFYRLFAPRCDTTCRTPALHFADRAGSEWCFVLEDLDAAGFPARRTDLDPGPIDACLQWLASFHATFLGASPTGLWRVGTYWHLETRPEELAAMTDARLRAAAPAIDAALTGARWQTLVHGDAKLANFCFSPDGYEVAAVDFQYAGAGVGAKDVAYFLSSLLDDRGLAARGDELLDRYFALLRAELNARHPDADADAVESEWRALWPLAWADFERFLDGWAPGHWKRSGWAREKADEALRRLGI